MAPSDASPRVLVVGGGAREHAIVHALARSPQRPALWCAPGNPGIAGQAALLDVEPGDVEAVVRAAQSNSIELVVVGPEAPLVAGIVDRFESRGLRIFGPSRAAAMIEGSKAFAKGLMAKHGVPTARFDIGVTSFKTCIAGESEISRAPIGCKKDRDQIAGKALHQNARSDAFVVRVRGDD